MTAVLVGAGYLHWSPDEAAIRSRSRGHAATVDRQEVERLIGALEADVRGTPSASQYAELGQLYLKRGRDTGDIRNYAQAEAASSHALELAPADVDARSLLASVRYSTHDFSGALDLARGIVAEDPSQVGALAIVGDAELELGFYDDAAAIYTKLAASHPDAAATSLRLARLAYLQGRPDEARRLAAAAEKQARATAFGGPSLSLYEAYRGQVELDTGHYDTAATAFRAALEETPGYTVALAGLARARAAQGRPTEAIELYETAVSALPDPGTVAALGDLYKLQGRADRAQTQYATVEVIGTLERLNQQVYNRMLGLFYADHDTKLDEALRLTEGELEVRKDVFGYDAYAWALYKNGRLAEARQAVDQALALRTQDAKILYHAGMISKDLGDAVRARAELGRALAINPRFDVLQAPVARAALAQQSARG